MKYLVFGQVDKQDSKKLAIFDCNIYDMQYDYRHICHSYNVQDRNGALKK